MKIWHKRKKLFLYGSILLVLFLFYQYRVMNVFDEIALASHSILPYTGTSLYNIDAQVCRTEDLEQLNYPDSYVIYRLDNGLLIDFLLRKSELRISIRWLRLECVEVELDYFYNLWTKHFRPVMYVCERKNGEVAIGETVNDLQKTEELFQKSGTSLEGVYETLNGNLKDMIKDWIRSNAGESRFSENDYGWYTVGELQIGSLD